MLTRVVLGTASALVVSVAALTTMFVYAAYRAGLFDEEVDEEEILADWAQVVLR